MLKSSWILLGLSIVCGLVTRLFLLHEDIFWFTGMRKSEDVKTIPIEKVGVDEKNEIITNLIFSMKISTVGFWTELVQSISFFMAIILIVLFLLFNY